MIVEAAGSGYDAVITYARTFRLADNVERLEFRSGSSIGYGNELRNTMIGNDDANQIRGEGGDDRLFGAGGRDTLVGGVGDDTLVGGPGSDRLVLGTGADTIVIKANDSGYGFARRDMVRDFEPGVDIIDLSLIDADTGLSGNQAFRFVGTGAPQEAGSVGFQVYRGATIISVNTDDDPGIELQLQLNGVAGISASDFIL